MTRDFMIKDAELQEKMKKQKFEYNEVEKTKAKFENERV
jgi:hypothetical protein